MKTRLRTNSSRPAVNLDNNNNKFNNSLLTDTDELVSACEFKNTQNDKMLL